MLTGRSPLVLLSGIGALAAVLLLVFRDTILSFVASLQMALRASLLPTDRNGLGRSSITSMEHGMLLNITAQRGR